MASITFIDKVTVIGTAWLNEVNTLVHTIFGGATTNDQARSNLGAATRGANSDITSIGGLTTPLSITQGGTDATTALAARTNLGITESDLSNPVTIAQGGTGATDAPTARSNLSAATSGANSDIQSLSGLTTPLSIPQGGTAASDAEGALANLGAAPAFRGCLLAKTAEQALTADVQEAVVLDKEIYDTDNFHDNVTNNTRITIPAGVNFVRFHSQISWGVTTLPNWVTHHLIKNGDTTQGDDPGGMYRLVEQPADNGFLINAAASAVLSVVAGDFFELYAFFSGGSGVSVSGEAPDHRTWFAMEVVG